MKIPIPDDWDGQDWTCVQVQWPNSNKWLALLAGFLTSPGRGRYWDERTGTITDVQAVGREIDLRNLPFNPCAGEPQTPLPDGLLEQIVGGCCVQFEAEDFMPCIDISDMLKIENGQLYARNDCCEWVAIGALSGPIDETVYAPPDDIDESQGIYPCGMAVAVADVLVDLAGYIWDNADNTFPPLMVHSAQSHVHLDLNNMETINATNQALIMKGAVVITATVVDLDRDDVIPPNIDEELACFLLPYMNSDGTVDADNLYAALKSWAITRFPIFGSGNNVFISNYWLYIRGALGKGNLADVAASGQFTDSGDCDCPADLSELLGPTDAGWYLQPLPDIEFTAPGHFDDPDGVVKSINPTLDHDFYGLVFQVLWEGGDPFDNYQRRGIVDAEPGYEYDVYVFAAGSDDFSRDWVYIQSSDPATTEIVGLFGPLVAGADPGALGAPYESHDVETPAVLAGNTILGTFRLWAEGDPGNRSSGILKTWLIQNENSPSHA